MTILIPAFKYEKHQGNALKQVNADIDQRLNHIQKIIATKSKRNVQNDIEPRNARINLTVKGRNVANTMMAKTTKTAALIMIAGEYLRRAEQVEVKTTSGVFPQRAFSTAVVINTNAAKISAYGTAALTNGIYPLYQTNALAEPNKMPRIISTQLGMQNRLFIITPP